jgi:hypothetical protein
MIQDRGTGQARRTSQIRWGTETDLPLSSIRPPRRRARETVDGRHRPSPSPPDHGSALGIGDALCLRFVSFEMAVKGDKGRHVVVVDGRNARDMKNPT